MVLKAFSMLVQKCRTRFPRSSFNLYQDQNAEADDVIHSLINAFPNSIVISEDGDFLINRKLHVMISFRYWKSSRNGSLFADDGMGCNHYALLWAYAFSGCDNTVGIRGLVFSKINYRH
jgi:hypothetical protein